MLACATAEHFQTTPEQAESFRRRYADLVAMDDHILYKIRRFLPVNADAGAAIVAVQRIGELCDTDRFANRPSTQPFE